MNGRLSGEIWETSTVAQPARDRQIIMMPDGRELCFAECGRPGDFPVLFLHGTPGGRLNRHPDEDVYIDAGVRLITTTGPATGDPHGCPAGPSSTALRMSRRCSSTFVSTASR
jgi:hypothetical protein